MGEPLEVDGRCRCGCGAKTPIARTSDRRLGRREGRPLKYFPGHHRRKAPNEYIELDRGFATPCWEWQLARLPAGYALHRHPVGRQMCLAHRTYYEVHVG